MPNAKDAQLQAMPRIISLGLAGSGKTTQFLTFPGKKFAYLFDPNAINSLRGYDVDYEEFLPDKLSLSLTSLSKEGQKRAGNNPNKNKGAELYRAWEADFEDKLKNNFFADYSWIMIDSSTTLLDMIMDGVLAINGRGGQWPQQDDYGPQMLAFQNIIRTITSMNCGVYLTGHIEAKQDDLTKRIFYAPLMTGRLKTKIPLLFSEMLTLSAEGDKNGNVNYLVQTKPDRLTPSIRTSMKGCEFKEDITIDFSRDIVGQGLAGLMIRKGILHAGD